MQNNNHTISTDVVIIGADPSGSVAEKNMMVSVLAGYAWDKKKSFVAKPQR